jgi:hypothetical protein
VLSSRRTRENGLGRLFVDHDGKIRAESKREISENWYSFVNRTTQLWNQLPADAIGTLSCKPSNFMKRVRKAINKAI